MSLYHVSLGVLGPTMRFLELTNRHLTICLLKKTHSRSQILSKYQQSKPITQVYSMKPEEKVRLRLLNYLTQELNYPKELITVEKELLLLPGCVSAPKRRLDVLVYLKKANELLPLLIIECKAGKVTRAAIEQVLGYNHVVKAPFVAVVGESSALTAARDGEILGGLLFYEELIAAL